MKIVYKLVKGIDNKLVSLRAYGKAQVEYKLGEWVTSPIWLKDIGYDLCIFSLRESATETIRTWEPNSILLECEAKNIHDIGSLDYLSINNLSKGKIVKYYEHDEDNYWPEMTRTMAEEIKPIKIL